MNNIFDRESWSTRYWHFVPCFYCQLNQSWH